MIRMGFPTPHRSSWPPGSFPSWIGDYDQDETKDFFFSKFHTETRAGCKYVYDREEETQKLIKLTDLLQLCF